MPQDLVGAALQGLVPVEEEERADARQVLRGAPLISVLFAAIYKVLPDKDLEWRDVLVGAVVTAFLFSIGKFLIGLYIGSSAVASSYGAAAL